MKHLDILLKSGKTIFSYQDIGFLLGIPNRETIKKLLMRLTKSGILQPLSSGLYALPHFDSFEFATLLKKNSYLSFETVLKQQAIIFQDYGNTLFLASDKSLTKAAF
jgi:predicted transcriptional regulator of viral defense system